MAAHDEPPLSDTTPAPAQHPYGKSYTQTPDFGYWVVLGTFAAGALLGAGAALLTAPKSGARTRRTLRRNARAGVRRLTRREKSAWARLRNTLDRAAESRRGEAEEVIADR